MSIFSAFRTYKRKSYKKVATGTEIDYTYDKNDRLTQVGNEVYIYDDNGNLAGETGGEAEKVYTYDSENRLVKSKITAGNGVTIQTYEYDFNGNRTAVSTNEITRKEVAGHRSAEGWHFDEHIICDSKETIKHINLYSKKRKFGVLLFWEG